MPDWLQQAVEVLQAVGMLGMLLWALYGGTAKVWVYGWMYHDIRAERDAWRAEAEKWERTASEALERVHQQLSR